MIKMKKSKIESLKQKIASKTAVIGVIGLGYIGLSLLEGFGKAGFPLLGYDLNKERMAMLKRKESYLNFMTLTTLFDLMDEKRFHVSSHPNILKAADVLVISVPTALDRYRIPDLTNLRVAFHTVYHHLKKDQLIILQSSTYPGTTEEELLPLLEQSDLKVGVDFFLANVPEVADIGNKNFSFNQVPRIIGGITPACQQMACDLYSKIGCEVVPCSSPKVAEAAKLLQNSYRLVNISLINEMKILFDKIGINVWEVIQAAASKPFGFAPFYPGPGIGGDCIPIVAFYLVWKARIVEGPTTPTTLVEQAGHINEMMPFYVFHKLIVGLAQEKKHIADSKILILGVGYKRDVNDIRESAALKLIPLLKKMFAEVYYHDPYVKELSGFLEYPEMHLKSIHLNYKALGIYDAVIIITDHTCYDWAQVVANSNLIIDTRNVTKDEIGAEENVIKA